MSKPFEYFAPVVHCARISGRLVKIGETRRIWFVSDRDGSPLWFLPREGELAKCATVLAFSVLGRPRSRRRVHRFADLLVGSGLQLERGPTRRTTLRDAAFRG